VYKRQEYAFLDDLACIIGEQQSLDRDFKDMNRTVSAVKRISSLLPVEFVNTVAIWIGKMTARSGGSRQAALYGINAQLENRSRARDFVLNLIDGMY
jgi:hypothetical protein